MAPDPLKISGVYVRSEPSRKSKFRDLDSALLNLKDSIAANVKNLPVPSKDMLTEIGLNVLRRAQEVRDSLVANMMKAKGKRRKVSARTAKAAVKTKKTTKTSKKKTAKKKSTRAKK